MHVPYPTQKLQGGRYQVLALLRVGGSASAWRAVDTVTGEDLALKVLPAANGGAERAAREAEVSRKVAHAGVAGVRAVFLEVDHAWMVMELAHCSLADHVATYGPLTPEQAARAVLPALDALAAAHALGIVHRDVKPHNLLLFEDGNVRLADWGAARARLDGNGTTRTGALLGTVPFLAPEQRRDPRRAEAPADVYAMAVTLAWLCLGEAPEDPALPGSHTALRLLLPVGFAEFVIAAGAYDPSERPTPAALREALAAWLDTRPGSAHLGLRVPGDDGLPDDAMTAVARAQGAGTARGIGESPPPQLAAPLEPAAKNHRDGVPSAPTSTRRSRQRLLLAGSGVAAVGLVALGLAVRGAVSPGTSAFQPAPSSEGTSPDTLQTVAVDAGVGEVTAVLGRYPRCDDYVQNWIDTLHPAPRETVGTAVHDLDGDGSPEVIFTNQQDENATLWWGERGRLPSRADTLPIGRSSRAVSPGDVDADGRADFVVYRPDEGMFDLWRGLGNRTFKRADTSSHTEILSAAILDWDGDRDLDLVMDIRALWRVGLRERTDEGWKPHRWVATGRVAGVVRAGGATQVLVRKEDGAMTLARPAEPRPVETPLFAAGDARGRTFLLGGLDPDGDGTDTLYLGAGATVLRHDPAGGTTCRFTDGAQLTSNAAVADLDGDGDVELVEGRTCASCTSNHVFRIGE